MQKKKRRLFFMFKMLKYIILPMGYYYIDKNV